MKYKIKIKILKIKMKNLKRKKNKRKRNPQVVKKVALSIINIIKYMFILTVRFNIIPLKNAIYTFKSLLNIHIKNTLINFIIKS
jgi:hypothetical protein